MLKAERVRVGRHADSFFTDVWSTHDLPRTLEFWIAYVARDLLKLGVYFRAAALLCEIPGGARYRPLSYDDVDPEALPWDDGPWHWVQGADRNTVCSVLAECLRRLNASAVLSHHRAYGSVHGGSGGYVGVTTARVGSPNRASH